MANDKHSIEVEIDAEGNVEFHVQGLKGSGCLTILKDFERALGKATGAPRGTTELHETVKAGVGVKR